MILSEARRASLQSAGLLLLRVAAGSMLALGHGLPKLERLVRGGAAGFSDPLGVGATLSLGLATFGEFVCALVVAIGYLTRLAAIPPAFTMCVAAVVVHAGAAWHDRELAAIYGLPFLALILTGPGRFSVDGWRARRSGGKSFV